MPDRTRHDEQLLDLPEDASLVGEHLDDQVQKAQEQLFALKRQQEVIERQKRELEELGRRQEQLQSGRTDMIEKFTRSLVVLERETYETQKRLETLNAIADAFHQHLDVLEGINPKNWEGMDINRELTKALTCVDDAQAEYARSAAKIGPLPDSENLAASAYGFEEGGAKDFIYWLKAGFAFTLPLAIVGLILIMVILKAI